MESSSTFLLAVGAVAWLPVPAFVPQEGPAVVVEHRTEIPEDVQADIADFLVRHDRCVTEGFWSELETMYSEDFFSTDLGISGWDGMSAQWQALRQKFQDMSLSTDIQRIDRLGRFYLVSGCRPFEGHEFGGDLLRSDDFCGSLLIEVAPDGDLKIVTHFEAEHGKLRRFDDRDQVYRAQSLGYQLRFPETLLPVPHRTTGSTIDSLMFIEPESGAYISLSLMDPSIPVDLRTAVICDSLPPRDDRVVWLREPEAFAGIPGMEAVHAESLFSKERFGEDLPEDVTASRLYASPDGRFLFAFQLMAPRDRLDWFRDQLFELAGSLELIVDDDAAGLAGHLLAHHEEWDTVHGGVYHHPRAPLLLRIPSGEIPCPQIGHRIQRLSLALEEDPGSCILLRVYEPTTPPLDCDYLLRCSLERLHPGMTPAEIAAVPLVSRYLEVLNAPAREHLVEARSPDGETWRHRIVEFDRDEYRVQVQLVPASDDYPAQDTAFGETLAGLEWGER
jgi:hypothetical protein